MPLVPVGLLTAPVAGSVKSVPPISLSSARRLSSIPSPPLPIRAVPAGFVPMRFAAIVSRAEPDSTMPLPRLAEMTFATTPGWPAGLPPIRSPDDREATRIPAPRFPSAVPVRLSPM